MDRKHLLLGHQNLFYNSKWVTKLCFILLCKSFRASALKTLYLITCKPIEHAKVNSYKRGYRSNFIHLDLEFALLARFKLSLLGTLEAAIGVIVASGAATAANNFLFLGCNLNRRHFFLPW